MADAPRIALHAATLAVLEPLILSAGFVAIDEDDYRPRSERSSFTFDSPPGHPSGGFQQRVAVFTQEVDDAPGTHRLLIEARVDMPALFEAIFRTRERLIPQWASRVDPTVALRLGQVARARGVMLPEAVAEGRPYAGIEELQARLPAIAALLREHLLPLLRGLDSVEAVAAAMDATPLDLAPAFPGFDDVALPVVFEQARHPRLLALLDEIDARVAVEDVSRFARAAVLDLSEGIRARRAAAAAAAPPAHGTYDKAEIQFLNFTHPDTPQEWGGRVIAMYLAWALSRGLGSASMAEAAADIAGGRSPVEVLFECCDGALTEDDLGDEGNAFTASYYEIDYHADFAHLFHRQFTRTGHPIDDAMSVPDSPENMALLSALLDRRYRAWKAARATARTAGAAVRSASVTPGPHPAPETTPAPPPAPETAPRPAAAAEPPAVAPTRWRRRLAALLLLAIAWLLFTLLVQPSNARDWSPDQARTPVAHVDGDRLVLENVRNATYRSTTDYDVRWETRAYDLAGVDSAWLVVEPFADWRGPAHVFVSFGFADGRYLGLSAEVRKERGETFSPLKGLLRQYELMLVAGDERDLIGLRALHRRDEVFLYRLRATPAESRALLEALLERANALAAEPAFYNTVTANCTTTLIDAVDGLRPGTVPATWRSLLPGYIDDLVYDLGLIDTALPRDTYRAAHRINDRAEAAAASADFSAALRQPR